MNSSSTITQIKAQANDLLDSISKKEIKRNRKIKRQIKFLKTYLGTFLIDEKKNSKSHLQREKMKSAFNFYIQEVR